MNEAMCYIGRKSCGCVVACAVDKPEYQRDNAKTIGQWMREGLTIEHVSVTVARQTLTDCPHKKPKVKKARESKADTRQPSLI